MSDDVVSKRERYRRVHGLSLFRACVLALVLIVHALLLGCLFLPVAPTVWSPRLGARDAALQVRFYFSNVNRDIPVVVPTLLADIGQPGIKRHGPTHPSTTQESSAIRATPAAPRVGVLAVPPVPPERGYVSGGGALRQQIGEQNVRVPGGSAVSHAPRFSMVDPRTQGIGGVVRFIGGLTGAVDSHCLDLEVWQGMTPAERIARRVSSYDMQTIADRYNCRAPRQRLDGVK